MAAVSWQTKQNKLLICQCRQLINFLVNMMKIGLMSDIHSEFYRSNPEWLPPLPEEVDVLILAGDIHIGKATIELVSRISNALPDTIILFVAGNHEFYKQHYETALAQFRAAFTGNEKIHFLENDSITIKEMHFFGATLWTGFDPYIEGVTLIDTMAYARNQISDFCYITTDENRRLFNPADVRDIYLETKQAITRFLCAHDPEKSVVITHFPPSLSLRNPNFNKIDLITSYFSANCDDLIQTYKPRYWLYGHHHWSERRMHFETECVTNQLCYPNEHYRNGWSFNPQLVINLSS